MNDLFRKEAVDAVRERALGELSASYSAPGLFQVTLCVTCVAAFILFAFLGTYTRRERVEGFVELSGGPVKLMAPSPGFVSEILIEEGASVVEGQPILTISFERTTPDGLISEQLDREAASRVDSLSREEAYTARYTELEISRLRSAEKSVEHQLDALKTEVALRAQRVESVRIMATKLRHLAEADSIAWMTYRQKQDEAIKEEIDLQSAQGNLARLSGDLQDIRSNLSLTALRGITDQAKLERQRSEAREGALSKKPGRKQVILAPVSGVITNLSVNVGSSVSEDSFLSHLVPSDSKFRVKLLVPSRAVGFVEAGQSVLVRYDAFPYQLYGIQQAAVRSVSRVARAKGDVVGPLVTAEPVFVVEAECTDSPQQSHIAQEIRPGMTLEADIVLDRMRVIDMLLEPIYRRGKGTI